MNSQASSTLYLADVVKNTAVEGPFNRYAIWVQGCPFRCKGCCNPHFLEFHTQNSYTVEQIVQDIQTQSDIEGITLLGGEPFAQASALALLAQAVHALGLGVIVFSGYTLAQLQHQKSAQYTLVPPK